MTLNRKYTIKLLQSMGRYDPYVVKTYFRALKMIKEYERPLQQRGTIRNECRVMLV